jgi:hypothetical protein
MRRAISVLVVVGLALAVVLLWANRGGDSSPGTQAQASTTTLPPATTSLPPDTTTLATTTTTSPTEIEIVETVEQAEAILRELWFGWFEGIYNEDEDRIREVVANPQLVSEAVDQFGTMDFLSRPTPSGLTFQNTEILLAREDCVVVWSVVNAQPIVGAQNDGVHVFVRSDGEWLFISQWATRNDLWEEDCQSQL